MAQGTHYLGVAEGAGADEGAELAEGRGEGPGVEMGGGEVVAGARAPVLVVPLLETLLVTY